MTEVEARRRTDAPFEARGPLSELLLGTLSSGEVDGPALLAAGRRALAGVDPVWDDDVQLSLFTLYALSYGSLAQRWAELEWSPQLIALRSLLEGSFEAAVRERVEVPPLPEPRASAVARALFDLTGQPGGPGLARYVAHRASLEQARELVVHRSVYTLREADPHSWAIPRLTGRSKAALVEIQVDEYGGGNPSRVHATIFARTVRGMDLDDTYGAYLDHVPAITLASFNLMSLFGLHRRLRGAVVGHLAAFEMTSSIPSRLTAQGFRRLGLGPEVTDYYDEHVEADAVHEQIAAHDLAGCLVEDEPALLPDVVFGAAACLQMDEWLAEHVLGAWQEGRSSLRRPLAA